MPVACAPDADTFFGWAGAHGVEVLATSGHAATDHWSARYRRPAAVLFGSEGEGLPAGLLDRAAQRIRIPMTGTAESLNLAVAVGILLYEIQRPVVEVEHDLPA